ncbi:NADH-quinone oxidoreductase subunit K, partial [Streptomyces sp. PSKA30]|nr:NADH-quinone oxidoreductase subunit K [Streptomyces sp. PSKA30]
ARGPRHSGQARPLFTMARRAAEIGIGLAIVLAVSRNGGTADSAKLRATAEGHEADASAGDAAAAGRAEPADPQGGKS